MIELTERAGWHVPSGWVPLNASTCKLCRREVLWCARLGRKASFDRSGNRHPWPNCQQVARSRPPRDTLIMNCPYCGKSGFSEEDLKRHVDARHTIVRILPPVAPGETE